MGRYTVSKKDFKRIRKAMQRYFDHWLKWMGLKWWETEIDYYFKTPKHMRRKNRRNIAARTTVDWCYMLATVEINVPALVGMDDRSLEELVIHELGHVLVNEMREKGQEHEERVVTCLTKAFGWVADAGRYKGGATCS